MNKILFIVILSLVFNSFNWSQNILRLKNEAELQYAVISDNHNLLPPEQVEKKSVGLAILYSVLLPGMGELYAGSYSSGKYFTIAEGVLWGTYIGMNMYGNWQKDRYKTFAASQAGVDINGKDEDYFAAIGEYINIENYNNSQALNRDFDKIYAETEYYWNWGTQDQRRAYRSMWISSEQTFNDLRFIVGGLILNRVASAINAVRIAVAHNKEMTSDLGWTMSVGLLNNIDYSHGLSLNFQTAF